MARRSYGLSYALLYGPHANWQLISIANGHWYHKNDQTSFFIQTRLKSQRRKRLL